MSPPPACFRAKTAFRPPRELTAGGEATVTGRIPESQSPVLEEAPALLDDRAVGGQSPAGAQIADEVPVDRGAVLAAGLRVRAAQGEVDGPADLLVEQDRAHRPVDPEVRADSDL